MGHHHQASGKHSSTETKVWKYENHSVEVKRKAAYQCLVPYDSMIEFMLSTPYSAKFSWVFISRISRIFNCSWIYFNENFWHVACSVCVQWIREIISMKSLKIAVCENLDPRKFSAIRYTWSRNEKLYTLGWLVGRNTAATCSNN